MNPNHIYIPNTTCSYPQSLTRNDHWSVMKLAWSDQKKKFSKVPIDLRTGFPANRDEMSVPFPDAKDHLTDNSVLSYRHTLESPAYLALIDCDNCIDPDGSISHLVQNLIRYMDVYAEYSVGGNIHLLGWLDVVPSDGHKDREWNVEFYWMPRSIPITGNRVELTDWKSPDDLQPCTQEFLRLHKARFPQAWAPPSPPTPEQSCTLSSEEILSKLFREAVGKKWSDIWAGRWQGHYESPSDADLALLMKFAFYTAKDRQMMESMFSDCPLSTIIIRGTVDEPTVWRTPKWANLNYRKRSLDSAIEKTTATYVPRKKILSAQELYSIRRQQIQRERN